VIKKYVFDGYQSELDVSEDEYFLQYFPSCSDPSSEFISLSPGLSSGVELASIRSFRFKKDIYAKAVSHMFKPVLLQMLKVAEDLRLENFYIVLPRQLENFMNLFKMMAYIGFKQVPPDIQKGICSAPCVLMHMRLL
jgi:hypothetical protein